MQIISAINELLATDDLDNLSVATICTQANISRPTFYRYFTDKYDAVCWYHYIYSSSVLYEVGRTLTWYEASLQMFEHVMDERVFYERTFVPNESYEGLVQFGVRANVEQQLLTLGENDIVITPELEYQVNFWAHSVHAAIASWIREGFPWTPEELARYLEGCRPQKLQEAMDGPVLERRSQAMSRNAD